jgi:excisionase family DNA binding protein
MPTRQPEPTRAVYVRLPVREADKLDRAAARLRSSKRDVIATLLSDHLDADGGRRRVIVEDDGADLVVGHHAFTPAQEPSAGSTDGVLTLDEAAELLRVSLDALRARAEAGDVPGRLLGGEWRFRRDALLDWLGARSS